MGTGGGRHSRLGSTSWNTVEELFEWYSKELLIFIQALITKKSERYLKTIDGLIKNGKLDPVDRREY